MIFTNCGKICILLLWIAEVDKLCEQCRIYLFKFGKALRRPDTLWKFNFFIIKRDKKDGTKRKREDNDDINYVDDDYRCQCWCKVLSCLQNICSIGNLLKALNATKYKYLLPDPEQTLKTRARPDIILLSKFGLFRFFLSSNMRIWVSPFNMYYMFWKQY